MTVKVKICGITRAADAHYALEAGADLLGFNFWSKSPRHVSPEKAGEIMVAAGVGRKAVGLFVDAPLEEVRASCMTAAIMTIQLHGDEPPEYCDELSRQGFEVIKVVRVAKKEDLERIKRYHGLSCLLLDTRTSGPMPGGTGQSFDWSIIEGLSEEVDFFLAGGLTPQNVAEAVRRVRPYGVDTAGGVEIRPGIKDPEKIEEFVKRAKDALI